MEWKNLWGHFLYFYSVGDMSKSFITISKRQKILYFQQFGVLSLLILFKAIKAAHFAMTHPVSVFINSGFSNMLTILSV